MIFEGDQGRKYASAISRIIQTVQHGLEEVNSDPSDPVCRAVTIGSLDGGSDVPALTDVSVYLRRTISGS